MRLLILFSLTAVSALAAPFSFGVKVGVPLTDAVNAVSTQNFQASAYTNRYIVGPAAELRLPFGLAVEFNALYRHFGAVETGTINGTTTSGAWEFPLMAKYRFPFPVAKPYVEAGVSWDTLSGLKQSIASSSINNTVTGFVLGVGLDVHAIVVHVSPEIRYTHWGDQHFTSTNSFLESNQNQAEFLVGITF